MKIRIALSAAALAAVIASVSFAEDAAHRHVRAIRSRSIGPIAHKVGIKPIISDHFPSDAQR
jgi:hypothetical protein